MAILVAAVFLLAVVAGQNTDPTTTTVPDATLPDTTTLPPSPSTTRGPSTSTTTSRPPPPPPPARRPTGIDLGPPVSLDGRSKACQLFAGIDEPLWERYNRNMSALTDLVQAHVAAANQIFVGQVFTADSAAPDLYFHLAHIQVMFGSCDGFENRNCTEIRNEYLGFFDRYDFSKYCLAYMFTDLNFDNGTAGLASIGTVCQPRQNSGFVTLRSHGEVRMDGDSYLTFAHELGHSFGAVHDEDVNDPECKGQGYIMSEVFNVSMLSGRDANAAKFSKCSVSQMHEKLSELKSDGHECYLSLSHSSESPPETSLCGNNVVEAGEECDCGYSYLTECHDACCYPALLSPKERYVNRTAIPCSRNASQECISPTGLVFGIYLPFAAIAIACVVAVIAMYRDWYGKKACFGHITAGNIRIVRR